MSGKIKELLVRKESFEKGKLMPKRDNRRKTERTQKDEKRTVMISSIGSDIRYHMETRNISAGGLFLEYEDPERLPFTESSIIEVWLGISDSETIYFNAKVARKVLNQDEQGASAWGSGIGIRIIQISKENSEKLGHYLEEEAKKANRSYSSQEVKPEKAS